jgi:hypothetical protein
MSDALAALSLANFYYYKIWAQLLSSPEHQYALKNAGPSLYLAAILNVILLAVPIWAAIRVARRFEGSWLGRLAQIPYLLVLLVGFNGIRSTFLEISLGQVVHRYGLVPSALACAGLGALALWILTRKYRQFFKVTIVAASVISPFVAVTFLQAAGRMARQRPELYADKPNPPLIVHPARARRALWLVFDELDQAVMFSYRPADLALPEFDRLRAESVYAEQALPPADVTELSLPALLTGRMLDKAAAANPRELTIRFQDAARDEKFSEQETVFRKAAKAGLNTGLVGWYHPYCRLIGDQIDSCSWVEGDPENRGGILAKMRSQQRLLLNLIPGIIPIRNALESKLGIKTSVPRLFQQEREIMLQTQQEVLAQTKLAVVDPRLDLVFVHFPVAHPPGIYNRFKKEYSIGDDARYLDNLALADRALGELRGELERSGLADKTDILVSSDHWFRSSVWRGRYSGEDAVLYDHPEGGLVPFLLKLAGRKTSATIPGKISTVHSADLLLARLAGKLNTPSDVAAWLAAQKVEPTKITLH